MACTNGSEPKPTSPPYFMVDSRETTCALWGQESLICKWISWAPFGGLVTAIVETGSFCASPPVYPSPLVISDFTSNIWIAKAIELAKAYAWSKYCKCKDKPALPEDGSPFKGGQCAHRYRVTIRRTVDFNPGGNTPDISDRSDSVEGDGPISFVKAVVSKPATSTSWRGEAQVGFAGGTATRILEVSSSQEVASTFKIVSVVVQDLSGQPDNCGDLPGPIPDQPDQPPPLPPPPANLPAPPPPPPGSAGPQGPPGDPGPPGKDADPCIPCKDGVDGLPGLDGKQGIPGIKGDTGLQGPQGQSGTTGATGSKGDTGLPGKDAQVEFVNIIVPFIDCNDYSVIETLRVIQVIKGTEAQVKFAHEQAAKIAIQQCEAGPPISAIPDWWQVRLQTDIPQLVIIYGPTSNRQYHDFVIPHPKDITKRIVSPLGVYTKGNFQGMVICKDNSKFIINAASAQLAASLCEEAILAIDPVWLESPPRVHISQRKGQAVKVEFMKPRFLMYFATGQRNTIPEWRAVIPG